MNKQQYNALYTVVPPEPLVFRWRDVAILVGWIGGMWVFIALLQYLIPSLK